MLLACLSTLSFYLPVSESVRIGLPVCLSFIWPSVCLSVSQCVLAFLYVCQFFPSTCLSVSLSVLVFLYVCLSCDLLSACQGVCAFWPSYMSVNFVLLPACQWVCPYLSAYMSVFHVSFYLPVSESVRICLPICLYPWLQVIAFNWLFFSLVILYISGLSFCFVFLADWSMSMYTVFLHD